MIKLEKLSPSLTRIDLDNRSIWFSYETPIAFQDKLDFVHIRKNDWKAITGKHINQVRKINHGKSIVWGYHTETFERILGEEFNG